MSFTKDSEKLIKEFLEDMENYCIKKSESVQKRTDSVLQMIYQDIKISSNFVSIVGSRSMIKTDVKKIKSLKELPKTELMDNNFMPSHIKDDILHNIQGYMKINVKISNLDLNIYYGIFNKTDFDNLKKIKDDILEAIKIVKFCSLYTNLKSLSSLNIYLYLTEAKKKLPENPVIVLNSDHCNSAVTYACATNGRLLVYRKEEWKKVLIHELFHSFCLDFSTLKYRKLKKNIKKIFDVQSDFEISESYAEFWAEIVNCSFMGYNLLDDKDDVDNFLLFTDFCIQLERMFSLFQMIKILNFMGLRYQNLYKDDKLSSGFRKILYKEDTNVLCYYIIKNILLFYYDDFFEWCLLNNNNVLNFDKTGDNLDKFYKFVKKKHNSSVFEKSVNKMELFFKKKRGPHYENMLNTNRMTICEN